jgi:hypothetical protein
VYGILHGVPDKRYGSVAWKRLRRQVIAAAGGACQVQAAGCTGIATTCDHIVPVALGGSFWDPMNLRASCKRCNYGAGSRIRETAIQQNVAQLHQVILDQQQELEQLRETVARYEGNGTHDRASPSPPNPAIY